MKKTNAYGTAIGYLVPKTEFQPKGEYKTTELDSQKGSADILLQSIDGDYYTLKFNKDIDIKGRGVKCYDGNVVAVTERIYNNLRTKYNVVCDF